MAYRVVRPERSRLATSLEKICGIAANTFRESLRQPVVIILLMAAALMILISPFTTYFTLMEADRMIKEMGLATIFVTGLLIAAFSAGSVISREIEVRTVLSVLSKPVGRVEFILGKYFGVLATLAVTGYVLGITHTLTSAVGGFEVGALQDTHWPLFFSMVAAIVVSLVAGAVVNFRTGKPFASTAVLISVPTFTVFAIGFTAVNFLFGTKQMVTVDLSVILAGIQVWFAVALMGAVAVAVSTRLQTVMTVVFCSMTFALGLLSDYLFYDAASSAQAVRSTLARLLYSVVPNLQVLWLGDALAAGRPVPAAYVLKGAAYALCYIAAVLFVAMLLFEDKEVS